MRHLIPLLALLLLITVAASASLAQEGPQVDETATAPYPSQVSVQLQAGFVPDPFVVSVSAGGEVDAGDLADGCTGFVGTNPNVSIDWSGEADFVKAFVFSDHDTVLAIQTPDGTTLCQDNANRQLLDPVIEIEAPVEGRYDVWIGSQAPNQPAPGFLVFTARPGTSLSTFDLARLVQRQPLPELLPPLPHQPPAALLAELLPDLAQDVVALQPGDDPLTTNVSSAGRLPAFELNTDELLCTGFVSAQPDLVFDWDGDADNLRVFFEGQRDATLVVRTPAGAFLCADDLMAGDNLNPLLDIASPEAGRYRVYVGRLDLNRPAIGVLTIAEGSGLEPVPLPASR